jgi:hypothetical protein
VSFEEGAPRVSRTARCFGDHTAVTGHVLDRVMESGEQGKTDDGFFGSAQLVVPTTFKGARFMGVAVSEELREQSASVARFLEALFSPPVPTRRRGHSWPWDGGSA